MTETHGGASGNHAGGRSLSLKIKKIGYFWPTMVEDCKNVAEKCVPCQRYPPTINSPTQALQAAIPAYPFMRWGMDIVGRMPRSRQCAYLLVITEYFTKWVEAKIVTDNGGQFIAATFQEFCASWNIKLVYSTPRYPQANGQVGSTNKTIVDGLKKRLEGYQGAWADELDGVLPDPRPGKPPSLCHTAKVSYDQLVKTGPDGLSSVRILSRAHRPIEERTYRDRPAYIIRPAKFTAELTYRPGKQHPAVEPFLPRHNRARPQRANREAMSRGRAAHTTSRGRSIRPTRKASSHVRPESSAKSSIRPTRRPNAKTLGHDRSDRADSRPRPDSRPIVPTDRPVDPKPVLKPFHTFSQPGLT
ncbi:unnamed protein product [Microthlaspi erraticum]|uniref:Integrase catalytic domain-containing protein n=1 Tax=Microthlaspi erraticum TaxID=1685480 RepID=A0A6D2J841_9BRAS|nr:unnamed protein product [Microthlaspi erraticum]